MSRSAKLKTIYASRKYKRERYLACKEAGICPYCGKTAVVGRIKCEECSVKAASYQRKAEKRKTKALRAFGVCVRCQKAEAMPKLTLCGRCSEACSDYNAAYRARLRERGICASCASRKVEGGFKTCARCRETQRDRKAKRIAKQQVAA